MLRGLEASRCPAELEEKFIHCRQAPACPKVEPEPCPEPDEVRELLKSSLARLLGYLGWQVVAKVCGIARSVCRKDGAGRRRPAGPPGQAAPMGRERRRGGGVLA